MNIQPSNVQSTATIASPNGPISEEKDCSLNNGDKFCVDPPSRNKPSKMTIEIEAIFVNVNQFWKRAPDLTSITLIIVNITIEIIAILFISKLFSGVKKLKYSAKATPTAAIDAVLITATADHPYKWVWSAYQTPDLL